MNNTSLFFLSKQCETARTYTDDCDTGVGKYRTSTQLLIPTSRPFIKETYYHIIEHKLCAAKCPSSVDIS